MEPPSRGRDRDISLSALRQSDPFIAHIVDVTSQVALYTYNPQAGEWEKTDIEGTLFVYTRTASPHHGFTIMNRLSMKNLVEPINKDLEFQLQDPFLLYRNSNLSIYSIWFYDKNDCHRIAQLMSKVVHLEAQQESPEGTSPNKTNGFDEENTIDILDMLSKAKEEYERGYYPDDSSILSSSPSLQNNVGLVKSTSIEAFEHLSAQQQDQHVSTPRHLTVEELFGTSVPKEQAPFLHPSQEMLMMSQQEATGRRQNLLLPFTYEGSTTAKQPESPKHKADFPKLTLQDAKAQVLMSPAAIQQSDKCSAKHNIRTSPLFKPALNSEALTNPATLAIGISDLGQSLQHDMKAVSPLMMCPLSSELSRTPQNLTPGNNQILTAQGGPGARATGGFGFQGHELLQKLKLTQQHEQQHQTVGKPCLAANFTPLLVTPESFKESNTKSADASMQVILTPVTNSSMLLSPSVFKPSAGRASEAESKCLSASPLTLASDPRCSPLPTVLSKTQLQDTLTHLIKNDSEFLSTIHEAYLQILTKNIGNLKL
eukprot:gi/632970289/ref/XP_007901566.1/ PREDICTED: mRNA-decapping enzyme 1A isoform X1 [Callorhinchus milii]